MRDGDCHDNLRSLIYLLGEAASCATHDLRHRNFVKVQGYRCVAVTAAGAKPLIQVLAPKVVDERSVRSRQFAILEKHADF